MVLRLIRALPGERPVLPPSLSGTYQQLDARVAASGPHDFAVRCERFRPVQAPDAAASIATRANVRDDRETSPFGGTGWRLYTSDLRNCQVRFGLDEQKSEIAREIGLANVRFRNWCGLRPGKKDA